MTRDDIVRAYSYFPNREITDELVDKFLAVYSKLETDYPNMSEQDKRYNLVLRMQAYDNQSNP